MASKLVTSAVILASASFSFFSCNLNSRPSGHQSQPKPVIKLSIAGWPDGEVFRQWPFKFMDVQLKFHSMGEDGTLFYVSSNGDTYRFEGDRSDRKGLISMRRPAEHLQRNEVYLAEFQWSDDGLVDRYVESLHPAIVTLHKSSGEVIIVDITPEGSATVSGGG